jgi:hypothetical protein
MPFSQPESEGRGLEMVGTEIVEAKIFCGEEI